MNAMGRMLTGFEPSQLRALGVLLRLCQSLVAR
jgi:hypothetical protein